MTKPNLKRVRQVLALFFLLIGLVLNNADAQSLKNTVAFHYDSLKAISRYHYPNDTGKQYSYVSIIYPVFADRQLDSLVKQTILSPLVTRHLFTSTLLTQHPALSAFDFNRLHPTDYQGLAENFIQQFEEQAGVTADRHAYWYAEIRVTVEISSSGYISCLCKKEYFSGGLHSLYDYVYLNYDPVKRRILSLESQIKTGAMEQLTKIADAIFRKDEGLKPNELLDGYFFPGGKFGLTANFTITDNGLTFLYTPYEIKPFAAGITKLTIPFKDLKTIVLPGSVLATIMANIQ